MCNPCVRYANRPRVQSLMWSCPAGMTCKHLGPFRLGSPQWRNACRPPILAPHSRHENGGTRCGHAQTKKITAAQMFTVGFTMSLSFFGQSGIVHVDLTWGWEANSQTTPLQCKTTIAPRHAHVSTHTKLGSIRERTNRRPASLRVKGKEGQHRTGRPEETAPFHCSGPMIS